METDLETERGIYLAPEFKKAEHRIGEDARNWLLRFIQKPLPQENTPGWDHLLYELMLLIFFWHYGSPQWLGEERWEGTAEVVNFIAADQERRNPRWAKIRLPPAKDVQEIQATLKTWLHDLMDTGFVFINVGNISEISFSISKNKKTARKTPGDPLLIRIGGGYKEAFLLTAANVLGDASESLRTCEFKKCPTPIFFPNDKKQKYCSPEHGANKRSKNSYEKKRKSRSGPSFIIEGGNHKIQLEEVHARLFCNAALPSPKTPSSRQNALKQKEKPRKNPPKPKKAETKKNG